VKPPTPRYTTRERRVYEAGDNWIADCSNREIAFLIATLLNERYNQELAALTRWNGNDRPEPLEFPDEEHSQ